MANYRKSFSFRNGVQVDDDNFIVNPNGLVGIGTTIPTEFLDVNGNVKVVGLVTATNIYAGVTTVGFLSSRSGILATGVITATSFSGSAAGLTGIYAVAVDGWYVSGGNISTSFNVGIGTTLPQGKLQIGSGSTFYSDGSATYAGIITASGFSGSFTGNLTGNVTGNINSLGVSTFTTLRVGTAITASSGIVSASTFVGNLTGSVTGSVTGNVTGNATGLSGTPNITVGVVTAAKIIADVVEVPNTGITTISKILHVGTGGTAFSALSSGRVGVGTALPTSEFQIRKASGSLLEVISNSGQARISIGQSVGVGKSTGVLRFGSDNKTFDIINNDTGNLNMYLHAGQAGVNTGRFAWFYGQNNLELASLTYTGRFGIGITDPKNTFHVVGTSTVSGNAFFGSNVNIVGNLSAGTITLPELLTNTNILSTAGFSTFYNVGVSSILDASGPESTILARQIGIGTDAVTAEIDAQAGTLLIQSVGIGTSAIYTFPNDYTPEVQFFNTSCAFTGEGGSVTLSEDTFVGFATDEPRSILDYGIVGGASTSAGYFITPTVSTIVRDDFSNFSGIGGTIEGAIIYNSTLKRHQGYGSIDGGTTFGWFNLY